MPAVHVGNSVPHLVFGACWLMQLNAGKFGLLISGYFAPPYLAVPGTRKARRPLPVQRWPRAQAAAARPSVTMFSFQTGTQWQLTRRLPASMGQEDFEGTELTMNRPPIELKRNTANGSDHDQNQLRPYARWVLVPFHTNSNEGRKQILG
jgi:hypothetical protein